MNSSNTKINRSNSNGGDSSTKKDLKIRKVNKKKLADLQDSLTDGLARLEGSHDAILDRELESKEDYYPEPPLAKHNAFLTEGFGEHTTMEDVGLGYSFVHVAPIEYVYSLNGFEYFNVVYKGNNLVLPLVLTNNTLNFGPFVKSIVAGRALEPAVLFPDFVKDVALDATKHLLSGRPDVDTTDDNFIAKVVHFMRSNNIGSKYCDTLYVKSWINRPEIQRSIYGSLSGEFDRAKLAEQYLSDIVTPKLWYMELFACLLAWCFYGCFLYLIWLDGTVNRWHIVLYISAIFLAMFNVVYHFTGYSFLGFTVGYFLISGSNVWFTILLGAFFYCCKVICGKILSFNGHFTRKFWNKASVSYADKASLSRTCPKILLEKVRQDPLHEDCKISNDNPEEETCEVTSVTSYGLVIPKAPLVVPNISCHHSLEHAFRTRIMFERSSEQEELRKFIKFMKAECLALFGLENTPELPSLEEYYKGKPYSAARKNFMKSIWGDLLTRENWTTKPFPKDEPYMGKYPEDYKTRAIVGRNDFIVGLWGPYFDAISTEIAHVFDLEANQTYDKKCTPIEIGRKARECSLRSKLFEIDASNWDGSISKMIIDFELFLLRKCFPVGLQIVGEISKDWSLTDGTVKGVFYSYHHARRSGDLWTSCFNSLINIMLVRYLFGESTLMIARGDDNFLGTDEALTAVQVIDKYKKLGFKAKVFERTLYTLEYCSGCIMPLDSGPIWGVKAGRVMAKFGLNLGKVPFRRTKQTLLGTAISMKSIACQTPIMGDLLLSVESQLGRGGLKLKPDFRNSNQWAHYDRNLILHYDRSTIDWFKERYNISSWDLEELVHIVLNVDWTQNVVIIDHPVLNRIFEVDCDTEARFDGWRFVGGRQVAKPKLSSYWTYLYHVNFLWMFLPVLADVTVDLDYGFMDMIIKVIIEEISDYIFGVLGVVEHIIYETLIVYKHLGLFWKVYRIIFLFGLYYLRFTYGLLSSIFVHIMINWVVSQQLSRMNKSSNKKLTGNQNGNGMRPKSQGMVGMTSASTLSQHNEELKTMSHDFMECLRSCSYPFAPECEGIKLPDDNAQASSTVTVRALFTITTDANSHAVFALSPNLQRVYKAPSAVAAGGAITWAPSTNIAVANLATLAANFSGYRVVCGGVRLTCLSSAMNTTGTVHIAQVPWCIDVDVTGVDKYPTSTGQFGQQPNYSSISLANLIENPLLSVFRRVSRNSECYVPIAYPAAVSTDVGAHTGWDDIVIYIDGAPASTAVMKVEVILRIEGISVGTNALIPITKAAAANATAMTAIYALASKAPVALPEARFVSWLKDKWNRAKQFYQDHKQVIDIGVGIVGALGA
jgi:hypothetical protein